MNAGTKSAQIVAVAATEGEFLFPSALAFADEQPEVSGLTGAFKFKVCGADEKCVSEDPTAGAAPIACPGDGLCSGLGSCNTVEGECICFEGYEGDECATAS